eukprot:1087009_1
MANRQPVYNHVFLPTVNIRIPMEILHCPTYQRSYNRLTNALPGHNMIAMLFNLPTTDSNNSISTKDCKTIRIICFKTRSNYKYSIITSSHAVCQLFPVDSYHDRYFKKRLGLSYADLAITNYDDMLQSKAWLTSISNFDTHLIGRFRNDFGGLGTGSIDNLLKILDAMNVVAPEIQFTLDFSYTSNGKELQILDTKWLVPQQYDAHHEIMRYKVGLDIHFKDTDTHRMLDPDNCHDQHTCRGNIISSAIRIRSIVDDEFLPATARKYKA